MHKRFLASISCLALSCNLLSAPSAVAAFGDIGDDSTADAVQYLQSLGVVEGYADGTFKPQQGINRAEFLKIVYRTVFADQELPECDTDNMSFRDIDAQAWYAQTLCIAAEEGVIDGYPDGTFKPGQLVNVAEAAKIVDRAMFEPEEETGNVGEPWYAGPIWTLAEYGALPTSITAVDRPLTRGEMAQIIYRIDAENSYLPSADAAALLGETDDHAGEYDGSDEDLVVMTADDCYADETYDPVERVCYIDIECDSAEDCQATIDELEQRAGEVLDESDDFAELNEEDAEALARYTVAGDTITYLSATDAPTPWMNDKKLHDEVWQYFTRMIPESARGYVGAYEIVTDGKEGTLAAVYQDETLPEGKNWVVQVDIADAYADEGRTLERTELAYSLIHEYAHLLTLNASQFRNASSCPSYEIEEGCTKEQAYLNAFYQRFWTPIATEFKGVQSDDELDAFYQKYQDRFVTDYAVTSPEEDIAESFAYFVLSKPKTDGIAAEKMKFFSQYGELRDLRSVIVQRLDGVDIAKR